MERKNLRKVKHHDLNNIFYFHQWVTLPMEPPLKAVVEDENGFPMIFNFNKIRFLPDDYDPITKKEQKNGGQ